MVRKTETLDPFTPTDGLTPGSTTETTTPTTTPAFRALKFASEVQAALEQRYSGPTKEINKFTYIPWNESTKEANKVFGYFGWSSSVLSVDYVETVVDVNVGTWKDPVYEPREFKGFKSIVRISIQIIDDYSGMIVQSHHDGVGYGSIQAQGNKDPMDTAAKAAKSDGISTAIKHYGDAFGLYLYDKEEQTPAPTTSTESTTSTTGSGTTGLTPGQVELIAKKFNTTPEHVVKATSTLTGVNFKPLIDRLVAGGEGNQPWKLSAEFGGLQYVKRGETPPPLTTTNRVVDKLPIPVNA